MVQEFLFNAKFYKFCDRNLYVAHAPKTLLELVLHPDLGDMFQTHVMIMYIALSVL